MKKIKKRCVGLALAGAAFVFFDAFTDLHISDYRIMILCDQKFVHMRANVNPDHACAVEQNSRNRHAVMML
jgi:hypothetical protein